MNKTARPESPRQEATITLILSERERRMIAQALAAWQGAPDARTRTEATELIEVMLDGLEPTA